VMICVPPGTAGDWVAYAYSNHWLSVYNDEWCTYPSVQMHEIGHNLGLAHSKEDDDRYGDQTGIMGYSYGEDEGPSMCFNNAKNWQLNWYNDQAATAAPLDSRWIGQLTGVDDYGLSHDKTVVVKVVGSSDDIDYYVGFNAAKGVNEGTREASNQVTVHARTGSGFGVSNLVAKLDEGEEYELPNFNTNNVQVTIKVNSINTPAAEPWYAEVEIGESTTLSPTSAPISKRKRNGRRGGTRGCRRRTRRNRRKRCTEVEGN